MRTAAASNFPVTRCPKCGHVRGAADPSVHAGICPACGIAYAKWGLPRRRRAHARGAPEPSSGLLERLRAQLSELPERRDPPSLIARLGLLLLLGLWTLWFVLHGIDWEIIGGSFMHNVNLPFHEFGHLLFAPLGHFMAILGGSLFQLLLPLGLTAFFVIRQRDNFAAAVTLWWTGQSFVDLAPYIHDAPYRLLPLVGGGGEESHDWGNLLTLLDALDSSPALARASFTCGTLLMLLALGWGSRLVYLQHRARDATGNV